MTNLNAIKAKFKLDSHHRMERFTVLFCAFTSILLLLFGWSLHIHNEHQKVTLTTQAKYTERTQWSITGQYVTILDIYRNHDSSKIFVLLRTGQGSDDMKTMSTDAADYQIFMTGYKKEKLTNNPKAAFYVFGNTGYMGLFFTDSRGFDAHMYDIVVRNNKLLTSDVDMNAQEQYEDVSYKYHNQIHLYANLAGTDAIEKDFLNAESASVEDIYAEVIASIDESNIRETLNNDLKTMNDYMSSINEYAANLEKLGVRVPSLPLALAGDSITLDPEQTANNPTAFDKAMLNQTGSVIQSDYNTADVSVSEMFDCVTSEEAKDTANNLYLVTDYVFPGGFQYNYQNAKLRDSLLGELMPEGYTFLKWVDAKTVERQTYRTINQTLNKDYYSTWYMLDGSEFRYNDSVALNNDTAIKNTIDNYVDAVGKLYTTKYNYQVQDLYKLLRLKASADTSTSLFSINNSDDVLIMY